MNALTKGFVVLVVAAVALCPLAFEDSDAYVESDELLLYQVSFGDCKGVAVHNYGSNAVDMRNYRISDSPALTNEGVLDFGYLLEVMPGSTLVIVEDKCGCTFCSQSNVITYEKGNEYGVEATGSFSPAKGGDDIYLLNSKGDILDAVLYGSGVSSDGDYWFGKGVEKRGDSWIQRHSAYDTDSQNDWFVYVYGQTGYEFDPTLKYDATVTPFLFPDSGGIPIYRALEGATESVRIEMYQLMSMNVLALLCELQEKGVEVQILLEGKSLAQGYDPLADDHSKLYKKLIDLGGEIRLIGVSDDVDRFDFDHAKFALIDGDTVIVTSENWTKNNTNGEIDDNPYSGSNDGNRGWGAVIESVGYYNYMDDVFQTDWSKDFGDVKDLLEVKPNLVSGNYDYVSPSYNGTFQSFKNAKVTPVLSNDNSYDALNYYVSQAEDRLYSQQQSLGSSYEYFDASSPLGMFSDKADEGVTTMVMFSKGVEDTIITKINSETNISAATFSNPSLHNKGIISDDVAWVSSINWTWNSFHDNREVCVAIESKGVADYFASTFEADFNRYYDYEGFDAELVGMKDKYDLGDVVFEVSVTPAGEYTYYWDLGDGKGVTKTTTTPRQVFTINDDCDRTLSVKIVDSNGLYRIVTADYIVGNPSDTPGDSGTVDIGSMDDIITMIEDNLYIVAPIIVIILGGIIAAVRHR